MTIPADEELEDRKDNSPQVPTLQAWKLNFGENKTLEITESVKIVEAHPHNSGHRITLLYKDLGTFTFIYKDAKSLLEPSDWLIKYEKRAYRPNLKFNKNRLLVEG